MVKPKKHLGQHFLTDAFVAQRIAKSLQGGAYNHVVEIGPGTGVLTQFLMERQEKVWLVEIDRESVQYLQHNFTLEKGQLIEGDFLRLPIEQVFTAPFALIGNYPYNISSQIIFKALEHRDLIPEIGGMFQKEVAERLVATPGSKTYGIISVFCALWYEREYLFTVDPEVFNPPPKVKSGVIRMIRRDLIKEPFDEKLLKSVVKMAFNQRRKTLRNALKSLTLEPSKEVEALMGQRAEQLSPEQFVLLSKSVQSP